MIIIGDVHGNLETLKALLAKIPQEEKAKGVCFVGDLIDRGKYSKQVIELVKSNYHCVMGNHEDMMLNEYKTVLNKIKYNRVWHTEGLWILNGGTETIDSYMDLQEIDGKFRKVFNLKVFKEHIKWINQLPHYLEFKDVKNNEGRYLVVSHSNIVNVWRGVNRKDHIRNQALIQVLWGRPSTIKDVPEIYNVHGHTPIKDGPKIKKPFANVDTGCFYNKETGYSTLTALQYPEMIVYQQKNID